MTICNNPACGRDTPNPSYCSRSCSVTVANAVSPKKRRSPKRQCATCSREVEKRRNTRCSYCIAIPIEDRKTVGQARDGAKNQHSSSAHADIRSLARAKFKDLRALPCASCGYSKHVEICHIKPLSSFPVNTLIREVNSRDNVIQLCPNCHWEFDRGLLPLPTGQA